MHEYVYIYIYVYLYGLPPLLRHTALYTSVCCALCGAGSTGAPSEEARAAALMHIQCGCTGVRLRGALVPLALCLRSAAPEGCGSWQQQEGVMLCYVLAVTSYVMAVISCIVGCRVSQFCSDLFEQLQCAWRYLYVGHLCHPTGMVLLGASLS
jgi:hypothetical protein